MSVTGVEGTDRSGVHADLADRLEAMRALFQQQGAPSADVRKRMLKKLAAAVIERRGEICAAISSDFGIRAEEETVLADVYTTASSIRYYARHLSSWVKPRRRASGLHLFPAKAQILPQPIGVVGIISPWNYPVNLALDPLAAAIAAGNRVMIKPSEATPATADLLEGLIAGVFSDDEVLVIKGDADVGAGFAALPFDHLMFTGSTRIGRKVMAAAAANLTPVTLELGGKSPCLLLPGADLEKAAASIVHGKLFNAGQTCIAPDYVLLPVGKEQAFIDAALNSAKTYYPTIAGNEQYSAIVNQGHYDRLRALLDDAIGHGGQVWQPASTTDPDLVAERKIPLSLIVGATADMRIMQEEIFGPVLPVLAYNAVDDAIEYINVRDRPLALYVFEHSGARVDDILARTWSGGVTVNDTLLHFAVDDLPFGGIGPSGMGAYHGREGFDTFSHLKPVLRQSRFTGSAMLRPPYGARFRRIVDFLLKG
jgi:acyl-CoA reductase-like NAD-dependent aldehyde dehydrogenase